MPHSTRRATPPATAASAPPPITSLAGIGPRIAEKLERLGVRTVQDLLFHLPSRYEDRTHVVPIGSLRPGSPAVVCGEVTLAQVRYARRRSLVCLLSDGTGQLVVRLFHFSDAQQRQLTKGTRVRCYAEARRGPNGLEMVHPEYRVLGEGAAVEVEDSLTPVYPATEGLGQPALRRYVAQALAAARRQSFLTELLPQRTLTSLGYPALADALEFVHSPPPDTPVEDLAAARSPAQQRLALEELLAHHLSLRLVRREIDDQRATPLDAGGALRESLLASLGFTLTGAQARALEEIRSDLGKGRPMYRLLQGDVGSGKTVVAALAALAAVESGAQVALMAPTELLAEQHLRSFEAWLTPLGVPVAWLSGRQSGRQRAASLEGLASGAASVVVGTHALFQAEVAFSNLGLVIVDEQHRFGVDQRLALRSKGVRAGRHPHQLVMTATPIPRTLAMTAYADLDTSVIDELPPGRLPVETAVVPAERRAELVARVHEACRSGQQAYWVCPLIEESEALAYQAATDTATHLAEALPDLRIGLVHGRLRPPEKDDAMRRFKAHETDLLVATTVVEVGVDVPNASLMVIENAERMGLAQLHQLRGRVGRGARRSACLLLYQGPLSHLAKERLAVMRRTTDGFEIAQRDLELRGPGEVLGTRQTGQLELRVADLGRDQGLLAQIGPIASQLLERHPDRVRSIVERWLGQLVNYVDA